MICPLFELTFCAQGRGDCIMGKFAELGKEYDVIVTQVTANQGLEFETDLGQACSDDLLTAGIIGRDGRTSDKFFRQLQHRGHISGFHAAVR